MLFGGATGGAIGTGIVYSLYNNFSRNANIIKKDWNSLEGVTDKATARIQAGMNRMRMGFKTMILGAVLLAPTLLGVGKSMEFNAVMSEVFAKAQVKNIDIQRRLASEAMRLGEATKFSAKQAAEGQVFLAQAGFKVNDIISAMPGVLDLAAAGNLDLARSADIASNILTAMGLKASEMGRVADVLALGASSANVSVEMLGDSFSYAAASAKGLNWSLEQTTAMVGLLGNIGIQGSTAGTAIQNFNRFLTKLDNDKLKVLGLTMNDIVDSAGNMKNVEVVLATILDSMKNMGNFQQQQILGELFGPRGGKAIAAFRSSIESGMDFSTFVSNLNNAAGAASDIARGMMDNLKGDITILKSVWETTLIKIGNNTESAWRPLVQGLTKIISFFGKMVQHPIGKWVIRLTSVVGGLAVALGLVVVVTNLVSLASAKAAIAFTTMGKTQLAATFASKGLKGGLIELGRSITNVNIKTKTYGRNLLRFKSNLKSLWSVSLRTGFGFKSLGTGLFSLGKSMVKLGSLAGKLIMQFLPMLLLTGAIALVTKSLKAFDEVLNGTAEPAQGFLGFLQKLGGIMRAVAEIWKSANSEGFTMSETLAQALNKLGILDMAIAIGTWIVRLKAFFSGMGEGIKAAWNGVMKPVFKFIGSAIDWVRGMLEKFGWTMDKNVSPLNKWAEAGKILGIVIMATLVPAFISLAISLIAATWPFLLVVAIIAGIIAIIRNWKDIVMTLAILWDKVWTWIKDKAKDFWDWFSDLPNRLFNWGKGLVIKLKEGIKSAWQSFKDWLKGLLDDLLAPIKSVFKWLGIGKDDAEAGISVNTGDKNIQNTVSELAVVNAENKANMFKVPEPTVLHTNSQTEIVKGFNINIDGEPIKAMIDEKTREELERN